MTNTFRDALQKLHTSIQLYTGQNPAAADVHPAELTRRLMDAMAASAAALAQPEPVAPSLREEAMQALCRFMAGEGHDDCTEEEIEDDFKTIRRALEDLPNEL